MPVTRRALELVLPVRLGTSFRWLLAASWATNLSDGIRIAAGPLLVAAKTESPFVVSLAALIGWLPPMLVGLPAGVLADRLDRRRLIIVANLARVLVMLVLVVALWSDAVGASLVLLALLVLGLAEVFADTTTNTLLPMVVPREDLGSGNSRLTFSYITLNQLTGPPIGAFLFAAGLFWPWLAQALLLLFGALLVGRLTLPPHGRSAATTLIRRDIAEGMLWLWRHPAVRTLAVAIFAFNITFGAAWAVMVLYATDHLGLGEVGFGLVSSAAALGGIGTTLAYGRITARVSLRTLMRACLLTETLVMLVLALTSTPWIALCAFVAFGAEAFAWGTTARTVRQRAVPMQLQGRVDSVYVLGVSGGLVLGSLIGGVLAERFGLLAPFWFAFAGSAIFLGLIWRELGEIAHADETST